MRRYLGLFVALAGAPMLWAQSQAPSQPAAPAAPSVVPPAKPLPAAPTPPPPPPPVDPARLAAAQDVIAAMTYKDTLMTLLEDQKEKASGSILRVTSRIQAAQAKPQELAQLRSDMLQAWWNAIHPDEMVAKFTEVYARLFTLDELHGLAAFYRTPPGRAWVKHSQELGAKTNEALGPFLQSAVLAALKVEQTFMAAHQPPATGKPGPYLPPGLHYVTPPNPTPAFGPKPAASPAPTSAPSAAAPSASTK